MKRKKTTKTPSKNVTKKTRKKVRKPSNRNRRKPIPKKATKKSRGRKVKSQKPVRKVARVSNRKSQRKAAKVVRKPVKKQAPTVRKKPNKTTWVIKFPSRMELAQKIDFVESYSLNIGDSLYLGGVIIFSDLKGNVMDSRILDRSKDIDADIIKHEIIQGLEDIYNEFELIESGESAIVGGSGGTIADNEGEVEMITISLRDIEADIAYFESRKANKKA